MRTHRLSSFYRLLHLSGHLLMCIPFIRGPVEWISELAGTATDTAQKMFGIYESDQD